MAQLCTVLGTGHRDKCVGCQVTKDIYRRTPDLGAKANVGYRQMAGNLLKLRSSLARRWIGRGMIELSNSITPISVLLACVMVTVYFTIALCASQIC